MPTNADHLINGNGNQCWLMPTYIRPMPTKTGGRHWWAFVGGQLAGRIFWKYVNKHPARPPDDVIVLTYARIWHWHPCWRCMRYLSRTHYAWEWRNYSPEWTSAPYNLSQTWKSGTTAKRIKQYRNADFGLFQQNKPINRIQPQIRFISRPQGEVGEN